MVSTMMSISPAHFPKGAARFAGGAQISEASFKAPETITHSTVTESSKTGRKEGKRTEKKPVEAKFTVKGDLSALLPECPKGASAVFKLGQGKNDALKLSATYTKPTKETYTAHKNKQVRESYIAYETQSVGRRWVEDDKFYYMPVPAHYEDIMATVPVERTRTVSKQVPVERTRTVDKAITETVDLKDPKKFLAVIELLTQNKKASQPVKELAAFLKSAGKDLLQGAEAQLKSQVKAAQDALKQLRSKTQKG